MGKVLGMLALVQCLQRLIDGPNLSAFAMLLAGDIEECHRSVQCQSASHNARGKSCVAVVVASELSLARVLKPFRVNAGCQQRHSANFDTAGITFQFGIG